MSSLSLEKVATCECCSGDYLTDVAFLPSTTLPVPVLLSTCTDGNLYASMALTESELDTETRTIHTGSQGYVVYSRPLPLHSVNVLVFPRLVASTDAVSVDEESTSASSSTASSASAASPAMVQAYSDALVLVGSARGIIGLCVRATATATALRSSMTPLSAAHRALLLPQLRGNLTTLFELRTTSPIYASHVSLSPPLLGSTNVITPVWQVRIVAGGHAHDLHAYNLRVTVKCDSGSTSAASSFSVSSSSEMQTETGEDTTVLGVSTVIRIQNVDQVRHTLCHGHTAHIRAVTIPPSGRSVSNDGLLLPLGTATHSTTVLSAELQSALHKWAAVTCADDGSIRVWSEEGQCRHRFDLQPDGDLLAILLHACTGTLVAASRARVLHAYTPMLSKKRTLDTASKLEVHANASLHLSAVPRCLADAGPFILVGDSCGVITVYSLLNQNGLAIGSDSSMDTNDDEAPQRRKRNKYAASTASRVQWRCVSELRVHKTSVRAMTVRPLSTWSKDDSRSHDSSHGSPPSAWIIESCAEDGYLNSTLLKVHCE
mmetsp:Transcript_4855/g.14826  ORF Transcript_4855/g.14826 Transcript_4855/m.14826 type:complete len:546 (-) Transcript_4855:34-1671(-)